MTPIDVEILRKSTKKKTLKQILSFFKLQIKLVTKNTIVLDR